MRIIYITATFPFSNGAESFFSPEVKELIRLGHEVLIVPRLTKGEIPASERNLIEKTIEKNLISPEIIMDSALETATRPYGVLRAGTRIFKIADPLTLTKNMVVFSKGIWLSRLARSWRADHIHAHWAATTATMAFVASEISGIPWSFTVHRADIVQNNLFSEKAGSASFVRFISNSGVELAKKIGITGLEKKAKVIHMGIELNACEPEKNASRSPAIILCPANLIEVKGHGYLIDAISILRKRKVSCELHIAGQGHLRDALEKKIESLSLNGICKFLDQLPRENLLSLYREGRVDIVTLPSVDLGGGLHEGIPVALMEAMSYGIPVISTNTGGIPELLYGDAGIMVPDKNPQALADSIEKLLKDPGLRNRIGSSGRRRVEEKFDIKKIVNQIVLNFERAS